MELIQVVIRNPENGTISGWMHVCYTRAVLKWATAHHRYVKQQGKMCVRQFSRWPNIRCIDRLTSTTFFGVWNKLIVKQILCIKLVKY